MRGKKKKGGDEGCEKKKLSGQNSFFFIDEVDR